LKRFFIVLVIVATLGAASYGVWWQWFKSDTANTWDLVPESALLVYETDQMVRVWNELQVNPIWTDMLQVPYCSRMKTWLESLETTGGSQGAIQRLLANKNVLISAHDVGGNAFDFVFYINIAEPASARQANQLLNHYLNKAGYKGDTRVYEGYSITDINGGQGQPSFSYLLYGNHVVGSFTAFLVEDVVRHLDGQNEAGFRNRHQRLYAMNRLRNDQGNLYVDLSRVGRLLGIFAHEGQSQALGNMGQYGASAFMDLRITDQRLLLNGFSFDDGSTDDFLATFRQQPARTFSLQPYLPERTAYLQHYSFDNPEAWQQAVANYLSRNHAQLVQRRQQAATKYHANFEGMYSWFGGELGLLTLESVDVANPDRILLVRTRDRNQALNELNKVAEAASMLAGDTLYRETFAGNDITQLYIPQFPELLLGPAFGGFEQSFYMVLDDFVVIGNGIQAIKRMLGDIASDNTWGRSVMHNEFLENSLSEANYSLMVNTSRSWRMLLAALAEPWQQAFEQQAFQAKNFRMVGVQFGYIDQKYYTSVGLHYQKRKQVPNQTRRFDVAQALPFDTGLVSKPWVVRNHTNNSREVLLQDSALHLHLVSSEGALLWTDTLGKPIVGKVYQMDYFRNKKLQYLFATDSAIHVLDRLGRYVEGYPLPVDYAIDHLSLVDYAGNRKYRLMTAATTGHVYLYDKEGKNLKGWRPRAMDGPLAVPPRHIRVRNRDCMVLVQQKGVVSILNRRGDMMKGFPIDLKANVSNPLFVDVGSSFARTRFTTITETGELVRFNLEGEVLVRDQLYKPSKETQFQLVPEATGSTFVIARKELSRLSLLDREAQLLFEKDYLSMSSPMVQYYRFDSQTEVVVVVDAPQGMTYMYDQTGKLANYQPLDSHQQVGMLFSSAQGQFTVYHVYNNQYRLATFRQ